MLHLESLITHQTDKGVLLGKRLAIDGININASRLVNIMQDLFPEFVNSH